MPRECCEILVNIDPGWKRGYRAFSLRLPTWEEVISREYHPWNREHIVIDTAKRSVAQNVKILRKALPSK